MPYLICVKGSKIIIYFPGQTGTPNQGWNSFKQNLMGEAEIQPNNNLLLLHAVINIYGNAAGPDLAVQVARDIEHYWNEADGTVLMNRGWFRREKYNVQFNITGRHLPELVPQTVFENTDPRNNYFRVEEYARGNISFVDGLNSNTGYFKLQNLLDNSTTAAHEFGHTLGLGHPQKLDIRGQGRPGIMYPRGTLVDPEFQYYPEVAAGEKGGTLNPFTRRVQQQDIDNLQLNRLLFNAQGMAVVGGFSSAWHEKHPPQPD